MVSRKILLVPLLFLVACGTPQEQCIRRGTTELRKIDRLIAETEGNLARGYSYEEHTIVTHEWVACFEPGMGSYGHHARTGMCLEPDEETIRREVPIDPTVEARKLDNLKARRKDLLRAANEAVRSCKAAYPEG